MGKIDDFWYWEPSDNDTFELGGFGSITIEGHYGTLHDQPGRSGMADLTGSFKFGAFNVIGSADLNRFGKVDRGKFSEINIQVTGSGAYDVTVGYRSTGPYVAVTVAGQPLTYNPDGVNIDGFLDGLSVLYPGIQSDEFRDALGSLSEAKEIFDGLTEDAINDGFQEVYNQATTIPGNNDWPDHFKPANHCFLSGTLIDMWPLDPSHKPKVDGLYDQDALLAKVWQKPIEDITPTDIVLSYDRLGNLVPGKVTRTFQNNVQHLLDVHGLKVTPGHVTLCGDGKYAGRHVPIIDILLSDGAMVRENGDFIRMSINKPVGSVEDQMVQVLWAKSAEDARVGNLQSGEMRVGTLLFDRDGEPVSVLDCLRAEGLAFDPETGLVTEEGQEPKPLNWFGSLPRPEDYILRRSRETLEGILTGGEWEGAPSTLIARRLRQTSERFH